MPQNSADTYYICRAHWHKCKYYCSYTVMAKPMKTIQLYYPMVQFLMIVDIFIC